MRRLYIRIYLAVLASIILSILLAGIAWRIVADRSNLFDREEFFVEAAQAMLPPIHASQGQQLKALKKWQALTGYGLALLDRDRRLIASAGNVDIGPTEDGRFRRIHRNWHRHSVALKDGRVLIGEQPRPFGGPLRGPPSLLLILGLIGVAVAIAAWPVVRRITSNLETLENGVAAFGAGNLQTRVQVKGKDEVARLAGTFNQAAERIEQLIVSNKTMLANASHELRSPLARLRMAVEAVGEQASPALRNELNQNVRELDVLVEEILTASRLDVNGQDALSLEEVDLVALAAEETARTGAELDAGQAPALRGDAKLLRRLLRNLLENAQRYGAGTSVEASVRLAAPGRIRISVCDRGPGVPEADRERIFEPFYRRGGASEASGGVGLGLALVRQIAEAHGGKVLCRARDGGGACFEAELPAHPARKQ